MKYPLAYLSEIKTLAKSINRSFLLNKTIVLSGSTGMILSYCIDALLIDKTLNVTIIALVRDPLIARQRFSLFKNDPRLTFVPWSLHAPIHLAQSIDYVVHGASTTDPKSYQSNPVETMTLNFMGAYHMLELAKQKKAKFLLLSSTEVYGQLKSEKPIQEGELGYLNLQDSRSSYNEGKRAAETLAAAYAHQHQVHVVNARLSRVYGPTVKLTDTKALSQFILAAIHKKPIILKSEGLQKFSYIHVADAVRALLLLLDRGENNQSYNIAHDEILNLKEIATLVARLAKVKFIQDIQQDSTMAYSKTTYAIQAIDKIKKLGFTPKINLEQGLKSTLRLIKILN